MADFETFFAAHGGRGFGDGASTSIDEVRKLELLPLVFALVPRTALTLTPGMDNFVPEIERHLAELGIIEPSRRLLAILKRIAKQLISSSDDLARGASHARKRKKGVADLRASGLYTRVEGRQNGRCEVCGILLDQAESVELDHIVPFFIMGDVPDCSNWRLLCGHCNQGKSAFLSALQAGEAWNWYLPSGIASCIDGSIGGRTRYVTLALRPSCAFLDCTAIPRSAQLWVQPMHEHAMPVMDLLTVRCSDHLLPQTIRH